MEMSFNGALLRAHKFLDDKKRVIAGIIMTDEGEHWSILVSTAGQHGEMLETIDKNIRHDNPWEYAKERYRSVVIMVEHLLLKLDGKAVTVVVKEENEVPHERQ